jgi:hypothetical protein
MRILNATAQFLPNCLGLGKTPSGNAVFPFLFYFMVLVKGGMWRSVLREAEWFSCSRNMQEMQTLPPYPDLLICTPHFTRSPDASKPCTQV